MALRHESDVSQGDWFARAEERHDLSSMGPAVFPCYARLRHPVQPGDEPTDPQALMCVQGDLGPGELAALIDVLSRHTATPQDCFFGLWIGFGMIHGSPAVGVIRLDDDHPREWQVPPAFPADVLAGPLLRIPAREYLLFRGPLQDAGRWGAAELTPGQPRPMNSPNLIWPSDRAWFVATEIDLPWTGIGGSEALIDDLARTGALDIVTVER